ncbi:SDR family NAD(P)-dependent oxidoreductase [Streptomyces sp. NPDC001250]|uniref:SDR family NAD(P)-dependent oxidoreductase n=1 Tax=unclassified Streptomyces TaxID=2593676 RepID=UPI0033201850
MTGARLGRFDFTSGTAIVTGAASGIGEQPAYGLAGRGAALALVDRDAARLERVADTARSRTAVPVATHVTDLADDKAVHRLGGEHLATEHPATRLVIDNAGAALAGMFDQVSAEEFDWLPAVGFRTVVTLTRALLPTLRARSGAHLANESPPRSRVTWGGATGTASLDC